VAATSSKAAVKDMLLLDVRRDQLGIETMGGVVAQNNSRNSTDTRQAPQEIVHRPASKTRRALISRLQGSSRTGQGLPSPLARFRFESAALPRLRFARVIEVKS